MKLINPVATKHFKPSELACKHCGVVVYNSELMAVLELVRLRFGEPVIITSGYRCEVHNKKVGGAEESKHLTGTAADISVKNIDPREVYDFLCDVFPNQYGIAFKEGEFCHIDVRAKKARWKY